MEQLADLLACLTEQQIKVLKTYLNAFARRGGSGTKLRKLLDILVQHRDISLKQCAYLLYGSSDVGTTKRLAQRLYGKMLDSLLIDINTERLSQTADHNYFVIVRLKKQLLQYLILSTTSQGRKLGVVLLRKVYSIASKHEFYGTIQEVLPLLKASSTGKAKVSKYQYWDDLIKRNEQAREAYLRAFDLHNRYQELHSYSGKLSTKKHLESLEQFIATLSADYERTGCSTSGYFKGVLQTAYYEQSGQYGKAISACKELIELLDSKAAVRSKARLGVQYANIAAMEFQNGRMLEALRYNELSISTSVKGSADEYHKLAQQVQITFHLEMFERAIAANDKIIRASKVVGELDLAIAHVFEAAIEFKLGNFKNAFKLLNQKFALSTDKLGWEFSVRTLRLLTLVEMGKLEEAETSLINIDRFVHRHAKKREFTKRDREIVRFLIEWSKSSFSYEETTERTHLLAKKLTTSIDLEWKMGTPELIPVDEWFLSKTKKKRGPKGSKKMKSNA